MFLLAISVILLNAVQHSSCERFNIVPSPDSPCAGELTGEPCLTLEEYVANLSLSSNTTFEGNYSQQSSNVSLNFHPGTHHLHSQLVISNIYSFTVEANTTETVIVLCREARIYDSFHLIQLHLVHISDIAFIGCSVNLQSTFNATILRSSFINRTTSGEALHISDTSVLIEQCTISNNINGAIYFSGSNSLLLAVLQTILENNSKFSDGGAIQINVRYDGNSFPYYISNIGFNIIIANSTFIGNRVSYRGGAIYFTGVNIIWILNSTFNNNSARDGVGGAIYSDRYSTIVAVIALINNTFSHNSATNCGVIKMTEVYHFFYNIIYISGSTFVYNRAIGEIPGNNESGGAGGVICSRSATVYILDSNFSHNSAAGDAGVIQADDSQVLTIERSIFSHNTAGGNGGVLQTDLYSTSYTMTNSTFTNNQAGGDGGVICVERAGRGGAISIIRSTLHLNRTNIYENTASMGEAINAYNSNVVINNPEILAVQEPMVPIYCTPYYDDANTTEQTTLTIEHLNQTVSTIAEDDNITMVTATVPRSTQQLDEVTSIDVTMKDGTSTVEPVSSNNAQIIAENQETGQHNLHATVPGYVALGVSATLLVLFALFGVVITIKVFRVKPPQPQRLNHLNVATNEFLMTENKDTLPEVHLVST